MNNEIWKELKYSNYFISQIINKIRYKAGW